MTFSVYWLRLQQQQEQLHALFWYLPGQAVPHCRKSIATGSKRCVSYFSVDQVECNSRNTTTRLHQSMRCFKLQCLPGWEEVPQRTALSSPINPCHTVFFFKAYSQYIFKPHSPILTWGEYLPCCITPVAWRKAMLIYFNVQGEYIYIVLWSWPVTWRTRRTSVFWCKRNIYL